MGTILLILATICFVCHQIKNEVPFTLVNVLLAMGMMWGYMFGTYFLFK